MKWERWTKDNLPPVGESVLIQTKIGWKGVTECFPTDIARNHDIEALEYKETHPDFEVVDPMMWWMLWPEVPKEE